MVKNNFLNVLKRGFTLMEILIVIGIIGILVSLGAYSYNQLSRSSRDATRKADLENISQALEQYRSNDPQSSYPATTNDLVSGANVYMSKLPVDPKTGEDYSYSATCANAVCTDYVLSADLEGSADIAIGPLGQTTPPAPTATAGPTATNTPPQPQSCTSICQSQGYVQNAACRTSCGGTWFTPNPNPPSTCTSGQVCCCK